MFISRDHTAGQNHNIIGDISLKGRNSSRIWEEPQNIEPAFMKKIRADLTQGTPAHHLERYLLQSWGTAVAQWLRCCATNRKVAGSIPASVSGFFIDIKFFRSHYGPGVDSASNRNEYQEYFLGVKAAGA